MKILLTFLSIVLSDFRFLLVITSLSFLLKFYLFSMVTWQGIRLSSIRQQWVYLLLILIASMFSDLAWIASMAYRLFFKEIGFSYKPVLCFIRFSWAWAIVEYQSLSLLIESLLEKNYTLNLHQKIFLFFNTILFSLYVYLAFGQYHCINPRPPIEHFLLSYTTPYLIVPVGACLAFIYYKIRFSLNVPKILRKQVKILLKAILVPHLVLDIMQMYPFYFSQHYIASNYVVVSISTILLTLALYFCARKMLGLRFLNFTNHIDSYTPINVIDNFKAILEQLSHSAELAELKHVAHFFFKNSLSIQPSRSNLYFRKIESIHQDEQEYAQSVIEKEVELFISQTSKTHSCVFDYLIKQKILILDEISFNDFYQESTLTKELLHFLMHLNADIFLPIFDKEHIIAYIIIEKDARDGQLYTNIERDEMVIFANYLAKSIKLLQNSDLYLIMHKHKEIRQELYKKHQEINQYKESIRSFLRANEERKIGVIFYKQRKFIFANKYAQDLIQINPNTHDGHPITKDLIKICQNASHYKNEHSLIAYNNDGQRIILTAIPNMEQHQVIALVYYPEITDILKKQISLLKNPSHWDYLLYLETTQSGKLINQLIPGSGEQLLQFKISLLSISLSNKATFIDVCQDDVKSVIELLHHISLREVLHTLSLKAPEKNLESSIRLFGINPIFDTSKEAPLLSKLNKVGTLFIENIHFLDMQTQNNLADFIRYGYFQRLKSDQKINSDVRILCSSNANLQELIQAGKFSKKLYQELNQASFIIPPLYTLPKNELKNLIEGFNHQSMPVNDFKNLLEINEKEQEKIIASCPVSLKELKQRIQQLLIKKSQKNEIYHEVQFNAAYNVSDPELIQAARLGKNALKDPEVLNMLMQKFKNQNKVAIFLGVNRSSVHRRCKDYNIL